MSAATASAAVPAPVERSRVRVIFAGLMLVLLLAALDQTIVATALPTIVGDLGGLDRLAWVTSAFLLAQTAVTPVYGKLGDLYGQAGSPERRDPVPDRVGAVRAGDRHDRVDRLPRRAGAGAGRADRADAGGDRRRRVPPGARQVPGSFRRRLRCCKRGRTAARRRDRGGGLVALDLLRKPARGDRLAGRPGRGAAHRPRARAAGHRLSRRRALGGRVGRDRVGHERGRNDLGMGLGAGGPRRGAGRAPARLLPGDRAPSARAGSPPGAASRPSLRCGGGAVADRRLRLFGSVTFLPLYFQTVDAATPTEAGLRLVPMMGGVLVTSIASGQLISRTGRYRVFPIVGTAVMAIGLFLLSRLDVGTGGGGLGGLPLGSRARSRLGDAGARADRPERRRLRGVGSGDLWSDAVPWDRWVAGGSHFRGDLHLPADLGAAGSSSRIPRRRSLGGWTAHRHAACGVAGRGPVGLRAGVRAGAQPSVHRRRRRGGARIRAQLDAAGAAAERNRRDQHRSR